jgi:hypothetical protein
MSSLFPFRAHPHNRPRLSMCEDHGRRRDIPRHCRVQSKGSQICLGELQAAAVHAGAISHIHCFLACRILGYNSPAAERAVEDEGKHREVAKKCHTAPEEGYTTVENITGLRKKYSADPYLRRGALPKSPAHARSLPRCALASRQRSRAPIVLVMTKPGEGGLSVARLKTHYIGQQSEGSPHAALNSVPPVFRHAAETDGANSEKDISKIKAGLVCRLNTPRSRAGRAQSVGHA